MRAMPDGDTLGTSPNTEAETSEDQPAAEMGPPGWGGEPGRPMEAQKRRQVGAGGGARSGRVTGVSF